jgi:hypothetical protein
MLGLLFHPDDEGAIFNRKVRDFYQTTRIYNLEDRTLQDSDNIHANATTTMPILANTH